MRRLSVVLSMIVLASACVNLRKPEEVAKCSAEGTCVDQKKDAAPLDLGGPDRRVGTDGESTIIEGSPKDGATPIDGTIVPPGPDGGPTDDAPIGPTPDGQPGQPDLADDPPPVSGGDAPQDRPPAPADARDTAAERPRDVNYDVAAGICATNGVLKPAGTPCRPAVGPCDIAENCDGLNADCPADKLQPASKECRAAAGDCDIAETCLGSSPDCPDDGFKQAGTVCRKAAGLCDYAEICSGSSPDCPDDALKQSSAVCREATSACDPPESCSGLNANCPTDVPAYSRPSAPNGVVATAGELQASITWNTVTNATGYNIKRATISGGPYTTIATAVTTPPFIDTGLDNSKTYYYVITSINTISACESSTGSTEVSVHPTGVCVKPEPPTVTATAGNGQVTLTWDAVTGATAYAVDRSETSATGYASLAAVTAPATTYVDRAVTFGKTYFYRVTTKGACDSEPSNEVTASPQCTPAATTPSGLAAATPNTGGVVVLTWNAIVGARTTDRYYIMRKTSADAGFTKIDEVIPPALSYSDASAVNGTPYNYAVTYFNGTCTSGNSNIILATAACVMDKPVLTAVPGNKKVDLTWTQPANGSLNSYKVYRKDTGNYTLVTTITGAGSTTYTDTTVSNGVTYTYYVTAIGNCSADSEPKTAAPVCTPLGAPTNLKASAANTQVTLNWTAVAGTDHYTVKRATTTGGPYTALTPAAPITTNSFTDTGLTNTTTYYYVVTASNGTCDSPASGEASATPDVCASQGLAGKPTLTITSSSQVKVDWTAATPAPSGGYNIMRSTSATGTFTSVGSVDGSTLTFTDALSGVTIGTTLFYEIKAVGTTCSTTSESTSIAVTCSKPATPVASVAAVADGTIRLTWAAVDGATAYTVSSSTTDGGPYTPIPAATNITDTVYTDTGLANTTLHYYVVTASNANQQCKSDDTAQLSARSCIIPPVPSGISAKRSGNKQVTLVWTNSTGAQSYNIGRSTTSGSGYAGIGTVAASPYTDNTATNTSAFYYVVTAASDPQGVCGSAGSTEVSVPSCAVVHSGNTPATGSAQRQGTAAEWCLVTCDNDADWGWGCSQLGSRTVYANGVQVSCGGTLPAQQNSGYAFYFTAGSSSDTGGGGWAYWNYWNGTSRTCP